MTASWLPTPWKPPSPLPGPIFTDRTVVRRYEAGDGRRLFEAVDGSRGALLPWMAWVRDGHRTVEESEAYVAECIGSQREATCLDFPMGIFDRESGRLLGGTGLQHIRPEYGEAEIGYWIRGDQMGRGLCTEAVGALLSAALRKGSLDEPGWGLRRVVICNGTTNHASRRVCEKLGLHLEGTLRKARYIGPPGVDGAPGWYDVNVFSRLADD